MSRRQARSAYFLFQEFLRYYKALMYKGERPEKARVDPKEMVKFLPWLSIWAYSSHEFLTPTLMGTAQDDLFGRSLTGTDILPLLSTQAREDLDSLCGELTASKSNVLRLRLQLTNPTGGKTDICGFYGLLKQTDPSVQLFLGCASACNKNVCVSCDYLEECANSSAASTNEAKLFYQPEDKRLVGPVEAVMFDLGRLVAD